MEFSLNIIIGSACNLNCEYCYSSGGQVKSYAGITRKNLSDLKALIMGYGSESIKSITVMGGGEIATENPKLLSLYLKEINKLTGKKLSLVTNGLIYNPAIQENLNLFSEINLSLHTELPVEKVFKLWSQLYDLEDSEIPISVIIVDPRDYTGYRLHSLKRQLLMHKKLMFELKPLEVSKTNNISGFDFDKYISAVKSFLLTPGLGHRLIFNTTDPQESNLFLTKNGFSELTKNVVGQEYQKPVYLSNIKQELSDTKCLLCPFLTNCCSEHPDLEVNCSKTYKKLNRIKLGYWSGNFESFLVESEEEQTKDLTYCEYDSSTNFETQLLNLLINPNMYSVYCPEVKATLVCAVLESWLKLCLNTVNTTTVVKKILASMSREGTYRTCEELESFVLLKLSTLSTDFREMLTHAIRNHIQMILENSFSVKSKMLDAILNALFKDFGIQM